jgi:hypothetical protein
MAKDDNSKLPQKPLFQMFNEPLQAEEQPFSEKAAPPPAFQHPPQFQAPPSFSSPVESERLIVTPPAVSTNTNTPSKRVIPEISTNVSSDWFAHNKKKLLVGGGAILGLVLLFFVVRFFMNRESAPTPDVVSEEVKSETTSAAPAAAPLPSSSAPSSPAVPMVTGYGYVQTKNEGSTVRLRDKPSEEGVEMTKIPNKSFLKVLGYDEHDSVVGGETGRWCHVVYNGKEGWVWGNYVVKNLK